MENKYLQRQEAINYPGKKLPVVFCIDVSDSMNLCEGGTPTGKTEFKDGKTWNLVTGATSTLIGFVKQRIEDFHEAMLSDKKTAATCQTAYITFGEDYKLIEDFRVVKNNKAPVEKIIAKDDGTFIVGGLKKALEIIDEQKKLLKENGNNYFQPWLIILTDGLAQDNPEEIKAIKKELIARQQNNKLIVYTMALNDDSQMYEQIRGYSINKPIPYDTDKKELNKFFVFLKKSISSISNSKISDQVPGYTGPEDIEHLL